jgi:hypothetical protein
MNGPRPAIVLASLAAAMGGIALAMEVGLGGRPVEPAPTATLPAAERLQLRQVTPAPVVAVPKAEDPVEPSSPSTPEPTRAPISRLVPMSPRNRGPTPEAPRMPRDLASREFEACLRALADLRPHPLGDDEENLAAIERRRRFDEAMAKFVPRDDPDALDVQCPEAQLKRMYEERRERGLRRQHERPRNP